MKTKMLLLLSIGMIGFTMMGSEPPLEQKPQLTVENDFHSLTSFVGTDIAYEISSYDEFVFEVKSNFKPNVSAILVDEYWQGGNRQYSQIPYREKLLENYNLSFKDKLLCSADTIRDNC